MNNLIPMLLGGILIGVTFMAAPGSFLLQKLQIHREYLNYADKMCKEPAKHVFIDGDFSCLNGLRDRIRRNQNET